MATQRLPELLVLLLVTAFLTFTFVGTPRVQGDSMVPLFEDGQQIMVERLTTHFPQFFPYRHDEVIVFEREGHSIVKRVIAVPGDDITVREGLLSVNGIGVARYADLSLGPEWGATIPPETLYVIGDNQGVSRDSREYGLVRYSEVVGRVLFVREPPRPSLGVQIDP